MINSTESGFTAQIYGGKGGLKLYARDYGAGAPRTADRLPLVCLPGLTRNSRDFHALALRLSTDAERPRRVVTLDYRGRGQSDWDEDKSRYNLLVEAEDVLAACDTFGISKAAFLGTSRGGLTLHFIAGMRPSLLKAAILNDIGPVIENIGLQDIRGYLGRARQPENWQDAAAGLRETHGAAFTALSDQDWADMARAIYAECDGRIIADFDPAIAEQLAAADLDGPLPDIWTQFEDLAGIQLMVIRGANSRLLSATTVQEMQRRHPGMTVLTVEHQGHAPLLHLGDVPAAIEAFLAGV